MSKKSLELLQALFAENSNLQLPVSVVNQVVEIRNWISKQLDAPTTIETLTKE